MIIRLLKSKKLKSVTDICPTCGQKLPNVHKVDTTALEVEVNQLTEGLQELRDTRERVGHIWAVRGDLLKETLELELQGLETKMQEVGADDSRLSQLQSEVDNLDKRVTEISNTLASRDEHIANVTEELNTVVGRIDEIKEETQEKDEEAADLTARIDVQKDFDTALKRDFRGILLQNCISYIDSKAKQYSRELFETDLLKFELDGNNISISYNDKEYESLSGGEKKKVDVIIQFAIRSMLCEYMNFSCNILVLDEIFDELDSKGCQKVIDFISNELVDISSVYIISHRADLEIPADSELIVVKSEAGISNVLG